MTRFPRSKPSFVVRPFIGPLPFPQPTGDKLEQLLVRAGISPSEDDPIRNPLWLEHGRAVDRDRVMEHVTRYSNSGPFGDPTAEYIVVNGRSMRTQDFIADMDRKAYEMLKLGADHRLVAAECYLNLEAVEAIRSKYELP